MTTAMYLRMSFDRTGEGLGVDRQREDLEALCTRKGWDWIEYEDNDKSATRGVRPAYQRMLKDIREGKVNAVAVWDLDRLHRQPMELEEFIQLADDYQLALASVDTSIDLATDSGRLYARIKGAVAKAEVERKSARQKRSMKQMADMGKGWGRRSFGYEHDHENPTIRDEEAQAIRQAYRDLLAGASLYSIAKQWNAAGLRTSQKGNLFDTMSVARTLRSPRMAGLRTYKGEVIYTTDELNGGGDWPAIVDRETWEAAQYLMGRPGRQFGTDRTRKRLLGGIAKCSECGKGLGTGRRANGGPPIYKCKTIGCFKVSRMSEPLDEWVSEAMVQALEGRAKAVVEQVDHSDTLRELNEEADKIDGKLQQVGQMFTDDLIDAAQLATMTRDLRERRERVDRKRESLTQAAVLDEAIDPGNIRGSWEAADVDRKRAIIKRLCSSIEVQPLGRNKRLPTGHGVVIHWNKGKAKQG